MKKKKKTQGGKKKGGGGGGGEYRGFLNVYSMFDRGEIMILGSCCYECAASMAFSVEVYFRPPCVLSCRLHGL